MDQIAVFVDAGYLFAAGSSLITGSKKSRTDCSLDIEVALKSIAKHAKLVEPNARLLRTYWYDGIRPYVGPSPEQHELGKQPYLKLRFGLLNNQGQQKGVDSLIVTDLIDLARNQAIGDALILAGDEDLRVGVQVAQSLGVRVHLLGIEPTRGNVSRQLRLEVDSISEMTSKQVHSFLSCDRSNQRSESHKENELGVQVQRPPLSQTSTQATANVEKIVRKTLERFSPLELKQFSLYLETEKSLPRDLDAPMLAQGRHELGRDLTIDEKRDARRLARADLSNIDNT